MGTTQLYSADIPFFQFNEDGFADSGSPWPSFSSDASHYHVSRMANTSRSITVYGTDIPMGSTQTYGMFPMERYLHEQPPFPGLLHTEFPRPSGSPPPFRYNSISYGYNAQSSFPVPAEPRRAPSPGATSSSRSHSLSPHDEVKPVHLVHNYTYASPSESSYGGLPYPKPDCYPLDKYSTDYLPGGGSSCIALQDIQRVPDPIADQLGEDYGRVEAGLKLECYPSKMDIDDHSCHEDDAAGESNPDVESFHYGSAGDASDQDYKPCSRGLNKRGRKRRLSQSSNGPPKRSGTKRSRIASRTSTALSAAEGGGRSKRVKRIEANNATVPSVKNAEGIRPFPCPLAIYSCTATFSSKNEWKRHVSTQHIRLGFWRCDLCPPSHDATQTAIYYNDFNRKDLFTQHLRRMHSSSTTDPKNNATLSAHNGTPVPPVNENTLGEHQARCYQKLRSSPPTSSCLFCHRLFSGSGSWEERMEHVGRHLEKDGKGIIDPAKWREDRGLRNWLLREGLIEQAGEKGWRLGDGSRKDIKEEDVEEDDVDGECEDDNE